MKLESLKELGSLEGAGRLMEYFKRMQYTSGSVVIRKIRTVLRILADAGIVKHNPFTLKKRTATGLRWAIEFAQLPERTPEQKFFQVRGRRHTKIDGVDSECRLRDEDIAKIEVYGNPALRGWRC